MKEGRPSFTAEGTAAMRGAESLRPADKRVCYDPYAKDFVGLKFRLIGKSRFLTRMTVWCAEMLVPGMVAYIVGRTRYIDEYVKARIADGIEQLVIMGAGYDSRAYRFDELKGRVKVFEVDFPATQKVKMERVKKVFGSLPPHVVYTSVDFNTQKLGERLFESGYDKNKKTLFIWEGVTPYVTPQAMDETLGFVANNSGKGSSIIFDYVLKSALDGSCRRGQVNSIRRVYELIGAPLTSEGVGFGMEDGKTAEYLSQRGFCDVKNVTGESFRTSYLKKTSPNLKVWCTVYATVRPKD